MRGNGHCVRCLDIDPRNGGNESYDELIEELGEFPVVYGVTNTPSGGEHLWIAPLGIGKHTGFMPGLDLQGGKPDGSSRGFAFLPPTVRPSKVDGELAAYVFAESPSAPGDPDDSSARLARAIERKAAEKATKAGSNGHGRMPASVLRQACLDAKAGAQRAALLAYEGELEMRGDGDDERLAILRDLVREMPKYDKRSWTERDLRGLFWNPRRCLTRRQSLST